MPLFVTLWINLFNRCLFNLWDVPGIMSWRHSNKEREKVALTKLLFFRGYVDNKINEENKYFQYYSNFGRHKWLWGWIITALVAYDMMSHEYPALVWMPWDTFWNWDNLKLPNSVIPGLYYPF